MHKLVIKLTSLFLCFCMLFSLVACKNSNEDNKKPNKSNSSNNLETSDKNDNGDLDVDGDSFEDILLIERPFSTNTISIGVKLGYDDLSEDDDLDYDIWDDLDDLDTITTVTYKTLIQSRGDAVKGKVRRIEVDNSKKGILFTNFSGISCNAFPTESTLIAQQYAKDSEAFLEIQSKRYNDIGARFCRIWFQHDWMVTNEVEAEGKKPSDYTNINKNPDYINYTNGVYDFENEYLQSVVDYCKMLEEADTDIYVAFGWKVSSRIQDWFSEDPINKKNSAPKDLKANANAAAALFKYMRNEQGLTNFNILSFYNEPHSRKKNNYPTSDFSTVGDKRVYFYNLLKEVNKVFDNDKELKDVLIIGVDHSGNMATSSLDYVSNYINEYAPELVDYFSFHHYINEGTGINKTSWDVMLERFSFCVNTYKHPIYITEYYACEVNQTADTGASQYAWDLNGGFDSTSVAYYIAAANTGVRGIYKWSFVGGYLPDPLFYDPADWIMSSWFRPTDAESVAKVNLTYYQEALFNSYIENDSNVHFVKWTGDDIRVSAFTSKNKKHFSLLVEAKEETSKKDFNIKLTQALSQNKLYVYRYNREIEENAQATIPPLYDTITLTNHKEFNYSIDDKYGAYIFTTKAPKKQIELYTASGKDAVYNYCSASASVSITPKFIDNTESVTNNSVVWEIKRYACAVKKENNVELKREDRFETGRSLGSINIDANGVVTYTPANDAEVGDLIAIRCSLASDKDRYASAIIEITN